MGWETLAPPVKASPGAPVRIGMRKYLRGRARLVIVIEAELLKSLGGDGNFSIQIGTGTEAHHLRIVADKTGLFQPRALSSRGDTYVKFSIPPIERLPDKHIERSTATYAVDKQQRALLIDLPSWAWLKKAA